MISPIMKLDPLIHEEGTVSAIQSLAVTMSVGQTGRKVNIIVSISNNYYLFYQMVQGY